MPTGLPGNGTDGGGITITYAFAGLVLLALAGLIVLRHLTGTISISRLGGNGEHRLDPGHHRLHPGRFHLGHGQELHLVGEVKGDRLMKVNDIFDIFGGILILALVATILTKPNTSSDINAAGNQFTGALKTAEAG